MATITSQLREHRQARGVTQEELGLAVGVSRQTIIAIERGNYVPSLLLAMNLARYFGVSIDKLFLHKK